MYHSQHYVCLFSITAYTFTQMAILYKEQRFFPQKKEPVVISKAGFQFSRLPLLEVSRYHNQGVEHEHLKNFLAAYQAPLDPFEGDLFDLFSVKSAMRTLLQTNISPTSGEGDLSFLGRPPGIPNLTVQ